MTVGFDPRSNLVGFRWSPKNFCFGSEPLPLADRYGASPTKALSHLVSFFFFYVPFNTYVTEKTTTIILEILIFNS